MKAKKKKPKKNLIRKTKAEKQNKNKLKNKLSWKIS